MSTAPQTASRALVVLPSRPKGTHTDSFRKTEVLTNHYGVTLKPMDKIVVFRLKFTPPIAQDNRQLRLDLMKKAMPEIKKNISKIW